MIEAAGSVPLAVKLAYTAFIAVLVPVYLRSYGPTNFLYFCDVALLLTLAGLWLDKPLLVSMAAAGILVPQVFWLVDYAANLSGWRISGMTAYMVDPQRPVFLRALSLFHGWLPLLLLYLVHRLGYDPRALIWWTAVATVLVLICYFCMPPPSPDRGTAPVNINYVYGFSDEAAQRWMPGWAWLLVALLGFPVLLYLPAHLLLAHFMPAARAH